MWVDDEKKDSELPTNTNQTLQNPSVGSGGSAGTAPGTGTSSSGNFAPATGPSSQTPQQFASVQDYLKTNQPQAEDLGQKVTSSLNTTLGNEKSAIDTAANQTQNDINAGVTNYNADLTNQALTDPTKVAGDQNKLGDFLKQWNASYSGPASFEASTNYTPAVTAANEAGQKAAQLGSEGGREQLIQDQFGVYGQGNKGLDQTLLQNSGAFPTVQNQAKDFGSVQDYLKNQAANVNTAATNAQATTDATKAQTQGAFANNLTAFQKAIDDKVAANQAAATAQANVYTDALKSGDATKISSALQSSNLTDAQRANLVDYLTAINKDYGSTPDLSNFYTANPATDINAANSASAQDYANAEAYKQLTGTDYSGVLNPADVAKVGQIPNVNNAINATGADQALRQYLMQKEIESLNPAPVAPGGSSSTPEHGKGTFDSGGTLDRAAGAVLTAPLGGIGAIPGLSGIGKGVAKLGHKISDSLGFGAKHKDAVVNLPELKLPEMVAPTTANAATTKAITDVFNKPIKDAGSYHEGTIGDMVSRLDTLKSALDSKQISPEEYKTYAQPLAQWTQQAYNTIMSAGSTAANSVKGSLPSFQNKYSDLLK